ncbi:DUF1456 family protein [Lacrimispora sp.]|uniref:DUF1456 family protein n=1 Tax=Lacrimispora sp. TaxID=2719234 RepID=UPI00399260BF
MDNNDILIRLRYALDMKDTEMVEIFKLGGVTVAKEELQTMLVKSNDGSVTGSPRKERNSDDNRTVCSNRMFESFLNGFIIYKRGKKESKPGETEKQIFMIKDDKAVNNVLLKKVKIALSLTGEDMLAILKDGGIDLSNGELSAVLRREGQRNYKVCLDRYARAFLKGLTVRYRKK